MKPVNVIIVLVLAVVVALVAYNYFEQPEPVGNRVSNAIDQLSNGNVSEAGDELKNQTRGDKMIDQVEDAVGISNSTVH
jgi:hypothetical protein